MSVMKHHLNLNTKIALTKFAVVFTVSLLAICANVTASHAMERLHSYNEDHPNDYGYDAPSYDGPSSHIDNSYSPPTAGGSTSSYVTVDKDGYGGGIFAGSSNGAVQITPNGNRQVYSMTLPDGNKVYCDTSSYNGYTAGGCR